MSIFNNWLENFESFKCAFGNHGNHIHIYDYLPESLIKLGKYFWKFDIPASEEIDYDYTYEHWKQKVGLCSSARFGSFVIRNLDWFYNYDAELFINTESNTNRLASGQMVSSCDDIIEQNGEIKLQQLDAFKYVVADTVDGLNSYGLQCNTNVVPHLGCYMTPETGTNPVEGVLNLCSVMVTRYILDHYKSVQDVIDNLLNDTNIFFPDLKGYEPHWMINDSNRCVILEIDRNTKQLIFIEPGVTEGYENHRPIMTNFHISGTIVDENGFVTRANDNYTSCPSNIEDLGSGVERYNLLVNLYNSKPEVIDLEFCKSITKALHYSNAYTLLENVWYTEFVGSRIKPTLDTNLTKVYSSPEDYEYVLNIVRLAFANKNRSDYYDKTKIPVWVTTHSSIFDLSNNQMNIRVGEESEKWIEKIIN